MQAVSTSPLSHVRPRGARVLALALGLIVSSLAGPFTARADVVISEDFDDGVVDGATLGVGQVINPSFSYPGDTRNTRLLSLAQGNPATIGGAWLGERIPLEDHYTLISFDFWIRHGSSLQAGEGLSAVLQFGTDMSAAGGGGGRLGTCAFPTDYVSVAFDTIDQGATDPETWCDGVTPRTCHVEVNTNLCPGAQPSTRTNITYGVEAPDMVRVSDQLIPIHVTMIIDDGVLDVYLNTEGDPAFHPGRVQVLTAALPLLNEPWALLGFLGTTSAAHDGHIEVDNVHVTTLKKEIPDESLVAFGNLHEPLGKTALRFAPRAEVLDVLGIQSHERDRVRVSLEAIAGDDAGQTETAGQKGIRRQTPETLSIQFDRADRSPSLREAAPRELVLLGREDQPTGKLLFRDDLLSVRDGRFVCSAEGTVRGAPAPVVELLLAGRVVATLGKGEEFTLPVLPSQAAVELWPNQQDNEWAIHCSGFGKEPVLVSLPGEQRLPLSVDAVRARFSEVSARKVELGLFASDYRIVDETVSTGELQLTSLGAAQISRQVDGSRLVLSNIGATGKDGVSVRPLEPAAFATIDFGPVEPNPCGGESLPGINFCGVGTSPDGSESVIGSLRFENDGKSTMIFPDFPSRQLPEVKVRFLRRGVVLIEELVIVHEGLQLPSAVWPQRVSVESSPRAVQLKASLTRPAVVEIGRGAKHEIDEICVEPIDTSRPTDLIAETCVQFICVDPTFIEPEFTIPPPPPQDLVAEDLEVTQAIQDFDHSVRLVAGKRTFVRFHVSSTNDEHVTFARLRLRKGLAQTTIYPHLFNGFLGHIEVGENPDREEIDESFYFELPPGYRSGIVEITADVNPILDWRGRAPLESNYGNNSISRTVAFESVPAMRFVFYRIGYPDQNGSNGIPNGTMLWPDNWQVDQAFSWMRRAYPISSLQIKQRNLALSGNVPDDGRPINSVLSVFRTIDIINFIFGIGDVHPNSHYYAMASDVGKFMRGWGWSNPPVSSGPTGTSRWANPASSSYWDDDGSYGDWYMAHEVGHTFGRGHPVPGSGACGHSASDASFPHAGAAISPTTFGDSAIYGFDFGLPHRVYGPDWKDVMSYCDFQWISDYTYEGILDGVQDDFKRHKGLAIAGRPNGRRLLVTGTIGDDGVDFEPALSLADAGEVLPHEPGKWLIVLRDRAGEVLTRHPFAPSTGEAGPTVDGEPEKEVLIVHELVPQAPGATTIEVLAPDGLVHSVEAGATPPEVVVITPNGGEVFDGETVDIAWEASDDDGDELTFVIEYSDDNGASWEPIALNVEGNEVSIARSNLASAEKALLRVIANDGINTAMDVSDAPFTVSNDAPVLTVLEPNGPVTMCPADTLLLKASGFDRDVGQLDQEIVWTSDLDGELGSGAELIVHGLSLGVHQITVQASDGKGGVTSLDVAGVTVVENPLAGGAETAAAVLEVAPHKVSWKLGETDGTAQLRVESSVPAAVLRFAISDHPEWVAPSDDGGLTPDKLLLSLQNEDAGALEPGVHTGEIVFVSPDAGGEVVVEVELVVPEKDEVAGVRFLRGDANLDSAFDVSDPLTILLYLFLGHEVHCLDAADSNDDGAVDISDALAALETQFLGGAPLPAPGSRECGVDPTDDPLDCERSSRICR